MSLITVSEPQPSFEAGSYEMLLVGFEEKHFDMFVKEKDSFGKPDNGDRWVWTWGDPEDDTLEIEQLTTCFVTPRSRAYENLVALLGPDAVAPGVTIDTSTLVGKAAIVTVGLNDKGYSKVEKVTAKPKAPARRARPVAVEAEEGEGDPDLPF